MLWTFHLFSIKAVFVGSKLVIYLLPLPTKLPDFIKVLVSSGLDFELLSIPKVNSFTNHLPFGF
jgi:hypothetical protein